MNSQIFYGYRFARFNIHYVGVVNIAPVNNNDLSCAYNLNSTITRYDDAGIFTKTNPNAGWIRSYNLNETPNTTS